MEINRKELLEVLKSVKVGIVKKSNLEQASHFVFTGKEVASYNDQVCITHPFKTDFKCTLPAEEFEKILQKIKEDIFTATLKDDRLFIKSKQTKASLVASIDNEIYECISDLKLSKVKKKLQPIPKGFIDGLNMCMFSVSADMTQTHLTCLNVSNNRIVSSDDFRISMYKLPEPINEQFLIPGTSVFELVEFPVTKYYLTKTWAYFATDDNCFYCARLVDAQYKDIAYLFDEFEEMKTRPFSFPEDTQKLVDNVSILAEGEFEMDKRIIISAKDGKVSFKGKNVKGWIEQKLKIDYDGEPFKILINPIFLSQILHKTAKTKISHDRVLFTTKNFSHLVSLVDED